MIWAHMGVFIYLYNYLFKYKKLIGCLILKKILKGLYYYGPHYNE